MEKFNNDIVVDLKKKAESLGIDEETLLMLVDKFCSTSAEYIGEIVSGFEPFDFDVIAKKAHKLKGAALNLGFTKLYEIVKEIEENARNELEFDYQKSVEMIKQEFEVIKDWRAKN